MAAMSRPTSLSLIDLLEHWCRTRPKHPAIVEPDGTQRTFLVLRERVSTLAAALTAAGVGRGGRVAFVGRNDGAVLELLLACSALEAVLVPINWRQSEEELAFVLEDVAPTAGLVDDQLRPQVEALTSGVTWFLKGATQGRQPSGAPGDQQAIDLRSSDPDRPVLIMYTAAFGGRPNGAVLAERALLAQNLVLHGVQELSTDARMLVTAPLFHIASFMMMSAVFHAGGTNVFVNDGDGPTLCRAIAEHRCTHGFLFGPTMDQIVAANEDGQFDLTSLRIQAPFNAAFAAMVSDDPSPWGQRTNVYGQTETMGLVTLARNDVPCVGSHGYALPAATISVMDDEGVVLPQGEAGQIAVRGPIVMDGYHRREELTARKQQGGWHLTGDLGRIEVDGSLTFIGPMQRMVKSAGENIYPVEVEACLKLHPGVVDAAIIGVPDAKWTQRVAAIVVCAPGTPPTEEDLIEFCRTRIASYKKPTIVHIVDQLPRVGGIVDYTSLDERFGGGGYPGGNQRTR